MFLCNFVMTYVLVAHMMKATYVIYTCVINNVNLPDAQEGSCNVRSHHNTQIQIIISNYFVYVFDVVLCW